jgi:hypothetical protein
MKIDKLSLMAGTPIPVDQLGIVINQPKIKDIAMLGEEKFYQSLSYFLINKDKLNIPINISDFDLFIYTLTQSQELQQSIADLFTLIIEDLESIKFFDGFILIKAAGHECIIDEPKFLIIKETLIRVFCLEDTQSSDLNPANEAAQKIAEKLKKRKELLVGESSKSDEQIYTTLISILVIGSNTMNLEDCLNLTIFQIQNLFKRFNLFFEFNIQMRSMLQGAQDIELTEWTKQF